MMNMNEHDTAVLIRSLLSAIKHLENMNAVLLKEVEKATKDAAYNKNFYDDARKNLDTARREIFNLKQQLNVLNPKRGRGRPRKVKP